MFSVRQKQKISEGIQQILRETNHPELPAKEIQFCLHVAGAEDWSWADIKNNGAVSNPSVNPWNEAQDREPQHDSEPNKVKPLAQYLTEYLHQEIVYDVDFELLQQAIEAYELTENVTIKIERV